MSKSASACTHNSIIEHVLSVAWLHMRVYILRRCWILFISCVRANLDVAAAAASLSAAINNPRATNTQQQHAPWGKSKFDIANE
jgi:hypothetical protein